MKIKTNTLITLLGVIVAILAASLPLTISILPLYLVKAQLISVAILFMAIMVTIIGRMLMNRNLLVKLSTLPIIFSLVMASLMVYYSGFYNFILATTGLVDYKAGNTEMVFKLMPIMHIGVWVCVLPLILGAFIKFKTINKTLPRNLDKYLPALGRIISIERTDISINHQTLYKVTLEIRSSTSDIYESSREVTMNMDRTHILSEANEIRLLVHEDKKDDFLFDMGQGNVF